MMRIRLTQKFADHISRISPSSRSRTGEIIDISKHDAKILLAQGWAESVSADQTDEQRTDEQPTEANSKGNGNGNEQGRTEVAAQPPQGPPTGGTARSRRIRRPAP